jgi:hypothetical protein
MKLTKNFLYSTLIVVSLISAFLVAIVALRYGYDSLSVIESGIGFLILMATAGGLGFFRNRPSRYMNYGERNRVILVGMILGIFWVIEISINNFIAPPLPDRDIIDNIFWVIIALSILIFAFLSAYRKNSFVHGIEVGIWNGLISGLFACCMALIVIVFGMRFVLQDPLNVSEWLLRGTNVTAPNMAAYFAFETFAGAFGHLTILGVVMGGLLGVIGGGAGKGVKLILRMKGSPR